MRTIDANYVLDALGIFSDCEHGDTHFLNGIETAREIVEQAPTVGGWISVEDKLPRSVINKVLVWLEHEELVGYIGFGHYEKYKGQEIWFNLENNEAFSVRGYKVTHWMPLPEPPREENDETD